MQICKCHHCINSKAIVEQIIAQLLVGAGGWVSFYTTNFNSKCCRKKKSNRTRVIKKNLTLQNKTEKKCLLVIFLSDPVRGRSPTAKNLAMSHTDSRESKHKQTVPQSKTFHQRTKMRRSVNWWSVPLSIFHDCAAYE
jgi:hypothetical protein